MLNKLLAMMTFVRVVDSGSFTAAAAQLGVSVSAVAKTIARLEAEVKTQLLLRSTRKFAVTDQGREYYARCQQILNDVEDTEASLVHARSAPKGRLRMVLPLLFGRLTFFPRVAEFNARYPDLELDVSFDDHPVDLIERGVDLAVYAGNLSDSRYIVRELNRLPRVTAASPAYLRRHAEPKTPHELAAHNCIINEGRPLWSFHDGRRLIQVTVRGNLYVSGGDALREAALHGLGIVQSNYWSLRHELKSGALKMLLQGYAVEGHPISILYPQMRHVPHKLRVMIDFLVEISGLSREEEEAAKGIARHVRTARPARRRRSA